LLPGDAGPFCNVLLTLRPPDDRKAGNADRMADSPIGVSGVGERFFCEKRRFVGDVPE